jgi:heterodisulfide reductase subunit A-like polyferredoxin
MNILVIGGGIGGISAAKVALKEGHAVTIVEAAPEPGGLMARIANCRIGFKTFFDEINGNERLTLVTSEKITGVTRGGEGYAVTTDTGRLIDADRVVVATGLVPYTAPEARGGRVLTSLEYDALIDQKRGDLPADFDHIAFVLCVGSRCREYPLCSSVCCSYTIREIKWTLQRANPGITVFYNDLRLFGQEFYLERIFRDGGVNFVRANSRYFEEDATGVNVRYFTDGKLKEERFSYVVLTMALRPNPDLSDLSRLFGFSLNEHGFVREVSPLATDAPNVFAAGGALEPMNVKDSILTGFGAGLLAARGDSGLAAVAAGRDSIVREEEPKIAVPEGDFDSWLFYMGAEKPGLGMFFEFASARFLEMARDLARAGKEVCVVTRNMVCPSYGELDYEEARRLGVVFIHLEEAEGIALEGNAARISGPARTLVLHAQRIVRFDDYEALFKDKEILSVYRSEPQLRWNPTRWGRKRYHVGFLRHPRDRRWEPRETLAAFGEMALDREEERVYPEVDEERCSGCGSCKEACPHSAIEIEMAEREMAIFGPQTAMAPIAHVKEDMCVGCGLCASTCPSDVITYS